ncbi:MAG: protein kinase, partial [Cyanobacteria bacterium HKST-UBA02]|nr:protein kinase [Cyanobacteria bacterium HKST-UBA02]
LKPSNILIRGYPEDPQVTVIDFGLARMDDQEDSGGKLTRRGTIVGSPLYMSPEQAGGKAGDRQSDIYSLACITVRMLTGKAPFEGEETFSLLQRKQKEIPVIERPADTAGKWPRGLEACLAKALAPDPQERYRGMSAFVEALERQVSKASAGETHTHTLTQAIGAGDRNRHLMLILGGALLLALAAATIVGILRLSSDDSPVEAPQIDRPQPKFERRVTPYDNSAYSLETISTAGVKDEDLKEIKGLFDGVEEVNLEGARIDGSGLRYLSGLEITVLNLSGTGVKDASLAYLRDLKCLHQLELQRTSITGAGLKELKGVKDLRRLSLIDCKAIKDADLANIKNTSLSQLDLSRTNITDAGLRELSSASHLTDLHLDRTPVTIEGLKSLEHLKLRALQVNNCPNLNGEVLALIARNWPDIEFIGISYLPVSHEQVRHLSACKNLKLLAALDSHMSDADMKVIGNLKELRWLYLSGGMFSNAGLEDISKLPNLKALSIHRTPLTKESVERLNKNLPGDCTFLTDQDDRTVTGVEQIGDFLEETGNESSDDNPR